MAHRDTFKTSGAIRAAAFHLSQIAKAGGRITHAEMGELHDSLCRALPEPAMTPASVGLNAAEMLSALKSFPVREGESLVEFERFALTWWTKTASPAIAKATGR